MKATELKQRYLEFFKHKGHAIMPSASLVPENDPTVLFTTAGMHPLVPFLLGQKHPLGKRITDVQKCIRTGDIDEVGDDSHLSFFEMLGNWSLGDYFKEDAIKWSFEFLTKILKINKDKLSVTVFIGDQDAPKDEESAKIWHSLGIPKERIYFLPKKDNWWGPAGLTGPCGPDTEMFIDTGKKSCSKDCKPGCSCGKYLEIWNDVFMQYNKTKEGKYIPLIQKNVDTGMGVERTTAILQGKKSVYETELFSSVIAKIKELSKKTDKRAERIIADHLRAAVFILSEGRIVPSNLDQGYVLRRFIRRSMTQGRKLEIKENFTAEVAEIIISIYKEDYPEFTSNKSLILNELKKEECKFNSTLDKGLKQFEKLSKDKKISGDDAFILFSSFGLPFEITKELAHEKNIQVDEKGYEKAFMQHQELSRKSTEGKFKGGLADNSEITTKLHTATHLLHGALREVLNKDIFQRGSNITSERLRFDFSFDRKLTEEELKKIELIINKKISENLEVTREEMSPEEAKKKGAVGVFGDRYGKKVSVYCISGFDKQICGGPHVSCTGILGKFKIIKEEAVSAGVRRIKAILE
ncbi:alanine--tRNA ligase [Candidatus Woesearchaeota archaeon]|nr:alanine--tRNA ligase [Candidatus Woesearchaeota archaeon]